MNSLLTFERQYCPVCKSENHLVLFEATHSSPEFFNFIKLEKFYGKAFYDSYNNGDLKGMTFKIVECNDCHFIFQKEVLNEKGMNLLYNRWLDKDLLRVHYSKQIYNYSEEIILRIIKKRFKRKNEIKVFDFGAGYGNFCSKALKLGFKTYAFDLSSDKEDKMDGMGVNAITNFDQYKNYFDLIWVNQVFEHVSDPGSIIDSLRECLTDNGIIFISTPNCQSIRKIIRKRGLSLELFGYLSPHQHINAFTHKSLVKLGENHLLKPFSLIDYVKFFNLHLKKSELIKLGKIALKSPFFGTSIFFSKI